MGAGFEVEELKLKIQQKRGKGAAAVKSPAPGAHQLREGLK